MEPTGADPLRPDDPSAIGPYRLLGRLGEGGMGTVYLATAPAGRLVAVKVVKAEFTLDEDFTRRFHAEVSNARKVASFCTAQVLDNGNAADGRPYMVTEYIPGTPLSRQIARYGPLEPGPLQGVALGVAAALAAIHVAGLVHRDLKPANVILSLTGPRVIDFGIARALDASHGFTQSGELLGSPGWWAPEQVRGEEVTPAADIFTWGCLVGYAGTGRHPFGRGDAVTLAARVVNSRPDLGALPAPLGELAARATDPDPARRPSAQDLLIALVSGVVPMAAPPVQVATEMLNRSWQPPPNLAAGPEATRVLDEPPPVAATTPSTAPSTTAPSTTAPSTTAPGTATSGISASVTAIGPSAGSAIKPAGPVDPDGTGRRETGASRSAPPGPGRRRSGRYRLLLAAAAVLAALGVTVAVLVNAGADGGEAPGTGGASPAATAPSRGTGSDIGRRIRLSGFDVQLLVPRPPRCGLPTYRGAAARNGGLCVIDWTLLNLGGEAVSAGPAEVRLIDDQGGEHAPDGHSTAPPGSLAPGGRADGVLIFDLPPDRRPARLAGRGVEVAL